MKRTSLLLLAILATSFICFSQSRLIDYVNPFVGTDFHGHTFPGAASPFGMVQLSPDTRLDSWDGCSGYHYSDSLIFGFTHTHLSGTGCSDYGDVLLMPVIDYGSQELDNSYYCSTFSHNREKASPGYYEVVLDRCGIEAQLTAGIRCGMHSYSYPKRSTAQVVIDLKHRDILLESAISKEGDHVVTGFRRSKAWAEDQVVYFHIVFDRTIKEFKAFGKQGALLTFAGKGGSVNAKIGISSVSVANARENLMAEVAQDDWNFEALRSATEGRWEQYLSKIDVRGSKTADTERLRTFYTALYHTAISPNIYSDVNGQYRGMDRQVHRAEGFGRYTVFSLWDTFRALHPLFTIIERERTLDFIKTFQTIYDEGGKLPIWELSGYETNCMIGYNSVSAIADAVVKGIDGFDVARMLDAMTASSQKKEFGLDVFRENGMVIADKEHESVSKTLEYAYDDWCVAQVAWYLYQKTSEQKYQDICKNYLHSALYYRNIFDPSTGFMRARIDGRWLTPFRPEEVNNHFTEANSWQYSFFVPQDIEGHIRLLGGDSLYCDKIDRLFSASDKTSGRTQADITGLIGQYAHGNEPSHHIPYLYAYAGQPWKTQSRVREIMKTMYSSAPNGLCGNEDCGQMSAWYVMSAIGLYSVTPGSDILVFGSPLFDDIVISLGNGHKLHIDAAAAEPLPSSTPDWFSASPYVRQVKLNGRNYTRSYIRFSDILAGGDLHFTLGSTPNKSFGTSYQDRPHSSICTLPAIGMHPGPVINSPAGTTIGPCTDALLLNPWFEMENTIFADSMIVSISDANHGTEILYQCNGDTTWHPYTTPITIRTNTGITAISTDSHGDRSFPTHTSLYKVRNDMSIKLLSQYNPQYNAGGDDGLIDGKRGTTSWRTGGWQGYQDTDFTAIVDLKSEKVISSIGAGFCQDARSWIWMPRYVEYSLSSDGEHFTTVGIVENTVDPQDYTIQTRDFRIDLSYHHPTARYIKVFAKNFGTIPDWHLGAGSEGFIFIDEIYFDN